LLVEVPSDRNSMSRSFSQRRI